MSKIEGRGFNNFKEWRRNFGPGNAGRTAFRLVARGNNCEFKPGCGTRGVETLDYDVLGELEQKLSCGNKHTRFMREKIEHDLISIGTNPSFGKNGRGRF
ncbi:MAG: hypothetical protein HYT08_01655 [Candidatus Levybacteria bacterium]|nr:hypothetical protein [Candidatus Levybacteria bacterium]